MLKNFTQQYPRFKTLFSFDEFNAVQRQCYPKIFNYSDNMIVSAPTSSGKTVLFELLIAKLMSESKTKCLYLAPIKSLCQEKYNSWRKKFTSTMKVIQLTGDTLQMEQDDFSNADIYVATPEKIDYISRKNLAFLKELNLLLIDEIHMLNMEDRGAILEAIVSRIMSINKKIRIMAVSATIPNIKEVAQWLKVPEHLICVFGNEYRPAKLNKIVLGFKPAGNDFNFEKMLNFKVLDAIRQYSYGRGSLIFCQTQKGTEEACNKIISQARDREFIENQSTALELINKAKAVDNSMLKLLIPQGVAFHNASLSSKDRSIVQGLFLDFKIKVLCTTSTLAMGINLPARLVIIKSTKCYKGSGKGYQEYSQIELDQMMGRAGRIPFDKEGTVVIMTEKGNYSKYVGEIKLENLQSQLYYQFIDHLNTEISLRSIQKLSQAEEYLKNSFCYIRMQNSPKLYKLSSKSQVDQFIHQTCLDSIKKLAKHDIIQYIESTEAIYPKQCSNNISRNAIEVDTIIKVIEQINAIRTERQFISLLCQANQLIKYRSKLDQRKTLKELNEKNKYTVKQAITTFDKKCFVMIQAELSGIYIDNWEIRRQSSESIYFLKRLSYCIKSLALERRHAGKTFWTFLFGSLFNKYFSQGFWQENNENVIKQIKKVASKWKNIQSRGIRSLQDLVYGLNQLDIFGNGMSSTSIKAGIQEQIRFLTCSTHISSKKVQQSVQNGNQNTNPSNKSNISNYMIKFVFTQNFTQNFRNVSIIIEENNEIYHTGNLNAENLQFTVYLKNTTQKKYFIAVIKDKYIGFDEFYWFQNGKLRKTELKREQNDKKLAKSQSFTALEQKKMNQKKTELQNGIEMNSLRKKHRSLQSSTEKSQKGETGQKKKNIPKQISYIKQQTTLHQSKPMISPIFQDPFSEDARTQSFLKSGQKYKLRDRQSQQEQQSIESTMKVNKKSKQLKLTQNFNTVKRKYIYDEEFEQEKKENNPFCKQRKIISNGKQQFRDLKSYNWKPGFQQILDTPSGNKMFENEGTDIINDYLFEQSNFETKPFPKQNKKLLLNQQEESEETQKQLCSKGSNTYNQNVISQLNNFMNKKNRNPVINKISRTKIVNIPEKTRQFQAKTTRIERNLPLTIKFINDQNKQTQFHQNVIENKKKISPSNQNTIKKAGNEDNGPLMFTFNKKSEFSSYQQRDSKKQFLTKKIQNQIENETSINLNKVNLQKNNKMKIVSPYDYFSSFLADDQEDTQIA